MRDKWTWTADYCKRKSLPAAQSWTWRRAEQAYTLAQGAKTNDRTGN